jgi:hypothetical protein
MDFTFTFLKVFAVGLYLAGPLISFLALTIILIGQIVGRHESWRKFDALYWSFITATTVGYGDIRPKGRISKVLSIVIAFNGIILTGLIVSLAIYAATHAFKVHIDPDQAKGLIERLRN